VCKLEYNEKEYELNNEMENNAEEEDCDYVVRRLTPKECERLQGFPDNWTNIAPWTDSKGKVHKDADSPRFKALGNSIATGPNSYWEFVLKNISAQYDYKPTMASLFDGIGGFPLLWDGINGDGSTLWASEIEEFPIAVTKRHFPKMQHLGDITKIKGSEVPIVDCVIGGSPCQDLSVAGKRAGLKHSGLGDEETTRSGLFMEQVRLCKEMREQDRFNGRDESEIRPRYCVWENVCFAGNTLVATESGYKEIKDITTKDKVRTHLGRYMPVVKTYKHENKDVIKLSYYGGEDIIATPNHPIWARKRNEEPNWKPIGNLTDEYYIAYNFDGLKMSFYFGHNNELNNKITASLEILCDDDSKVSETYNGTALNVVCSVIEDINAHNIKQADFVFNSENRETAYAVAYLMRNSLKIGVHIEKSEDSTYIISNCENYFYDKENNIVWQQVKNVTKEDNKITVYNLSVLEDNTYGANDILGHNCGAFSSNQGEDFRAVLEEFCKVTGGTNITIPRPNDKGKWTKNGCIMGDKFSIAWSVHNAKDWCVPQSRQRICVVADFGGQSAPQILFEQKGMSGDSGQSTETKQGTSRNTEDSSEPYH